MTRPSWDEYFLNVARVIATRGTCDRLQVGAVLVHENRVLETGYNGAPSGWPSCDEIGHQLVEIDGRPSCVRTLHAEENALLVAAKHGTSVVGATVYTTASCCYDCFKRLAQAGIKRIVYERPYTSARSIDVDIPLLANRYKIELCHLESALR